MLHYFLSCGINKEEVGELILDDAVATRAMELGERDLTDDGHIYTSKNSLGFLTVNLGDFVRGRKNTLPAVYAAFIDERDHQNNAKDLAIMVRCNFISAYINQIAGSNYRSEARKYLPMSYMIC